MKIVGFESCHIDCAARIAGKSYQAERGHVPALPPIGAMPDLTPFAENGLGVAAFEEGEMVGFLCCVPPFQNAFRSTDAAGVFSPMGANGALPGNRAEIYARMYQAAAKKWAEAGASSHAVCLYAHDMAAQEQFFRYGFGLRCIDAIREMDGISAPPCKGFDFSELAPDEYPSVLPLAHMLDAHMTASPTFLLRPSVSAERLMQTAARSHARYFAGRIGGRIAAFIKAGRDGETFIRDTPGYIHITGAFCLPEYRGMGVSQGLLDFAIQALKSEGHTRLGVDFESFNPAAYGFWPKYFAAYTHGVVRRIDEHALKGPDTGTAPHAK